MAYTGTIETQESFFLAISSDFKQQADKDIPLANEDIDILLPLVDNAARPNREQQNEKIYDCDGVHIRKTYINSELLRWNFSVQPSARIFAGFMALAKGAVSAWAGSAVAEVKTLTSTATGGTFTLGMTFEGRTGMTAPIPYNANAATIKAALEAMERPIEEGDIASVTGTLGTGLIITFGGKLANVNLPPFVIDNTNATGGTVTQAETTNGANKVLTITRASGGDMALFSFVTGYKGNTASYKKRYNQAVNSVTLEINKGQISSVAIEIIGSTKFTLEPTFTVPQCVNYDPVRAQNTRINANTSFITGDTRRIQYILNNNMVTDADAYPFDSIFMHRFRRGLRQTETIQISADGSETDEFYIDADKLRERAVELSLGSPNDRAVVIAPLTELSLQSPDITYSPNGDTIINVNGEPHKDAVLQTYSKVEYRANESVPFLEI